MRNGDALSYLAGRAGRRTGYKGTPNLILSWYAIVLLFVALCAQIICVGPPAKNGPTAGTVNRMSVSPPVSAIEVAETVWLGSGLGVWCPRI
jgi:hypothetical protein